MKRADNSAAIRNFDKVISDFSENDILDIQAMINVRGGSADGEGSTPIIIRPK